MASGTVNMPDNPELTFNQFLLLLFRIAVVFFDINYNKGNGNEVRNFKKLLSLFSRIELT